MTKISEHLSLKEVTKSNTALRLGISNSPNKEQLENLKLVAENVFEPIRNHFGVPIGISSGFRGNRLNKAVKGSLTSDHCHGKALDIDADIYGGLTNAEIFYYIKDNLDYKQLIWEYGDDNEPAWVHVSYDPNNNKKTTLKILKGGGYKNF
jgi:zinc D-Ala-D-Ala carboxypeptidase